MENNINNGNRIMGHEPELINSTIEFKGKNNILFCEKGVRLKNTTLNFKGSNSIIYLSSSIHDYILNVDIYNNSTLYIDENNYMNGKLNIILSEMKNVIIGKECLFSFGIWMRLADPHLIYDCETKKRTNLSKSIFIGDHVWIGQSSMVLKGSHIGSGSIIGAMTLLSNKKVPSNTIWGGNPAKQIKKGIFFSDKCVHSYTTKETNKSMYNNVQDYIYENDGIVKDFNEIEHDLEKCNKTEEKLEILKKLRLVKEKNRFYIHELRRNKYDLWRNFSRRKR